MSTAEEHRHDLIEALRSTIGHGPTGTLMEYLPPVGWADVATKRDLSSQDVLMRADLERVETSIHARIDQVEASLTARLDQVEARLSRLERRFDQLEGRFDQLEGGIDQLEGRFDQLEGRIGQVESRFDQLEISLLSELRQLEARTKQQHAEIVTRLSNEVNRDMSTMVRNFGFSLVAAYTAVSGLALGAFHLLSG